MSGRTYKYGFDQCTDYSAVKARWKSLATLLHPDHGGDATLFAQAREEAEERTRELAEQPLNRGERQARGSSALETFRNTIGGLMRNEAVRGYVAEQIGARLDPAVRDFLGLILKNSKR